MLAGMTTRAIVLRIPSGHYLEALYRKKPKQTGVLQITYACFRGIILIFLANIETRFPTNLLGFPSCGG